MTEIGQVLPTRQAQVLNMLSWGHTVNEIAEELEVTNKVVYHQMALAKESLGAKTTYHAISLWMTPLETVVHDH